VFFFFFFFFFSFSFFEFLLSFFSLDTHDTCTISSTHAGYLPKNKVLLLNGRNILPSRLFKSLICSPIYKVFKFPYATRLYSHSEYAPPNTKLVALLTVTKVFVCAIPNRIILSPTNDEVPGNAMFAIVKNKNTSANLGIVCATPP